MDEIVPLPETYRKYLNRTHPEFQSKWDRMNELYAMNSDNSLQDKGNESLKSELKSILFELNHWVGFSFFTQIYVPNDPDYEALQTIFKFETNGMSYQCDETLYNFLAPKMTLEEAIAAVNSYYIGIGKDAIV